MALVLRKRPPFGGTDDARKRRARTSLFTISQRDFQKYVRFRDAQGYTYALPLGTDSLYRQYVENGTIDSDKKELGEEREVPLGEHSSMLYLRKPRTKKLTPQPSGQIELLDLATQKLYTATVSIVVTSQMNRPGHIILDKLVDTGRRAKGKDFTGQSD